MNNTAVRETVEVNSEKYFDVVKDKAHKLEQQVLDIAQSLIPTLSEQEPDIDWSEIIDLHREALEKGADYLPNIRDEDNRLGRKAAAFERINLIKKMARSYAPILFEREHDVDTGATENALMEMAQELHDKGASYEDFTNFSEHFFKDGRAPTWHPTEGLSPEGIELAFAITAAAETPAHERQGAYNDAFSALIKSQNVAAQSKWDILTEFDVSNIYAFIHNEGAAKVERILEDAGEKLWNVRKHMTTDTALNSWDWDSDGKNNAEVFAAMAKECTTNMGALDQLLESLETLKQTHPEMLGESSDLFKLETQIRTVKRDAMPVYERTREITRDLAQRADIKEREAYYRDVYKNEFEPLKNAYKNRYHKVDPEKQGFNFWNDMVSTLTPISETLRQNKSDAYIPFDNAVKTIRRSGLALEKIQPRENDFVRKDALDNLFNSEKFRARGILTAEELSEIDSAGGISVDENKGGLSSGKKHEFFQKVIKHAQENGNRADIIEDLYDANPLSFDGKKNGYPDQERMLAHRMELRQMFQFKFTHGINSDAQPDAELRTHFYFNLFNVQNGQTMNLNEDMETLLNQHRLTRTFLKTAASSVKKKISNFFSKAIQGTVFDKISLKSIVALMRAASDAQRGAGLDTQYQTLKSYVKHAFVLWMEKMFGPFQLGGGMALGRFGADEMIAVIKIAQFFKEKLLERNKPIDMDDPREVQMMCSALQILYTSQGRDRRYKESTPGQVAAGIAKKMVHASKTMLDLQGKLDKPYIKPLAKFRNDKVESFFDDIMNKSINRYNDVRFAHSVKHYDNDNAEPIFNTLADITTMPNTIAYVNNASRPAAKGSSAPRLVNVRAIEDQKRHKRSGMQTNDRFGTGAVFVDIHNGLRDGTIIMDDVQDWLENEDLEFSRHMKATIGAGITDPTYALKKLGWENATFDQLREIGKNVRFMTESAKEGKEPKEVMVYEGPYKDQLTDEQIYFANDWYDWLKQNAMMEAALMKEGEFPTLQQDIDTIIDAFKPSDNSPALKIGKRSMSRWLVVKEVIEEYKRNGASLEILRMRDEQLTQDMVAGYTKEEAMEFQGGEAVFRQSASSHDMGTLAHYPFHMGNVKMGVNYNQTISYAPGVDNTLDFDANPTPSDDNNDDLDLIR